MSIKRDALWNLIGAGAPLVVGAFAIPYLIHEVGVELLGLLTLIWSLIGYFSLFDLGLSRALTQQLSAFRSAGRLDELPGIMKTGMMLTGATGVVGGVVLAALALPLGFGWLNVSVHLQTSTAVSLAIAAIGIPMATLTNGLRGALEAYGEFRIANLQRLALGASNFALPALSVAIFGASLPMMVLALLLARLVILVTHFYFVIKLIPISWMQARLEKKSGQRLYSFGIWMTVTNIVSPLLIYIDRFFISSMLGAAMVAYYSIPFEIIVRVLIIPGALMAAIFPRMAAMFVSDQKIAMALYYRCLKYVFAIMIPIVVAIMLASKWGLTIWLGAQFSVQAWPVLALLALGLLFNSIAQVPFAAIQAIGNSKLTAVIHIVEFMIYVPVLYFSLRYFGLFGAAVACVFRYLADALFLLIGIEKITRKSHA